MRRISADTLIALFLLVLCGAFFADTFTFRSQRVALVESDAWPRVIILALALLSAGYLVQSLRGAGPAASAKPAAGIGGWIVANRNVLFCFAFYGLFLLTLPWLGMLLGGTLFVFATLTALGRRDLRGHAVHLAIAVISIGAMWALFTYGLGVILPEGEILPR